MRRHFYSLAICLSLLAVVGCMPGASRSILGTWSGYESGFPDSALSYEFRDDGSLIVRPVDSPEPPKTMRYSVEGDYMTVEGGYPERVRGRMTWSGNSRFTYEYSDSRSQTTTVIFERDR